MTVNPFWMGVLVAIIVEIVACIVFAVVSNNKGGKK